MKGNQRGMVGATGFLFLFGCSYAYLVRLMDGKHKGYTWVLVVVGTAVVVLTMGPVIGWKNAMKLFAGFAAAGLPMSFENILVGVEALQKAERTSREIVGLVAARGSGNRSAVNGYSPQASS